MMKNLFVVIFVAFVLVYAPEQSFAAADSKASANEAVMQETIPSTPPEMSENPQAPLAPADSDGGVHGQLEQHAASGHEESGGLPQLNVATYPSQIFWLLVMFAILYVSFSKSILPAIGSVVNARDSMIKADLDSAQSLKEQAAAIQTAYEKSLEQAKAQASKAVMDVESAAKKKAAEQVEAFRKKADSDVEQAETRVMAAKEKALGQMTSVAAEVASIAAEKITGMNTDRQNAHAIVENIASKAKAA